ncbi:MAG: ATP-binding cassette domain-containing protein [Methanomicrobiaceae archaeon]|nr:ATP-binding cassette domain-containing protein [Methanomicrobiaceae archaeon]
MIAVDHVSFDIEDGEIFGLLGPNGAGKTTIISMLSTTLRPTSGSATVTGKNILTEEDGVRKAIGIVFQDPSLDEELTAYENMDFHGRLYRIPRNTRHNRILELLRLVGLEDRKEGLVKTYSGGMRRRLEIARGLLHEPKVLFLDEPTLGLDPQTRNLLWEYIERLNEEKQITIILTTHYMDEADRLCDRVAIIDRGRIIAMDTPEQLKNEIGGDVVTITAHDPEKVSSLLMVPWVSRVERHDGAVTIHLERAEEHIPRMMQILYRNAIEIDAISLHKPTLEDVFLHFTGRSIREEGASGKEMVRTYMRRARR